MKHIFTATFVLLFVFQCYGQGDRVVVSFTSVNAYGNNLYIHNMSIGTQFSVDVAVLSINNVKADTSYAIGTASHVTAPKVTVVNLGLTNISTPFSVTFTSTPGGYTSTKTVSSLNKGQVQEVTFDILTIPVSTGNATMASRINRVIAQPAHMGCSSRISLKLPICETVVFFQNGPCSTISRYYFGMNVSNPGENFT